MWRRYATDASYVTFCSVVRLDLRLAIDLFLNATHHTPQPNLPVDFTVNATHGASSVKLAERGLWVEVLRDVVWDCAPV